MLLDINGTERCLMNEWWFFYFWNVEKFSRTMRYITINFDSSSHDHGLKTIKSQLWHQKYALSNRNCNSIIIDVHSSGEFSEKIHLAANIELAMKIFSLLFAHFSSHHNNCSSTMNECRICVYNRMKNYVWKSKKWMEFLLLFGIKLNKLGKLSHGKCNLFFATELN